MKILKKILCCVSAAAMLAAFSGCSNDKSKLVMATNAEFAPYEYHEGDGIVGIDVEIAQAIAKELGRELVIEDMAFDSIIPAVTSGKADIGLAGMTVDPDRLKSVNFSDPYTTAKQVIIVKEGAAIASPDDLQGKNIGVQLGTTGDQLATEYEQNDGSTVERFNKGADAIQALKQGKIDCVVIDYNPAKAFVEKNDDLQILDEELSSEEYAMCVNKDNSELTAKINEALTQLKEDGTLDAIVSNYIGDEAGQHPYTSPEGVDRSNGTLVMATNATFEPYEYYEDQKVVGIDPDIAQAVCDVLGYDLKIEDMEFDAIVNAVVSGKADFGAAGMTVTDERKLSVDFTDTYATASQVIIVTK